MRTIIVKQWIASREDIVSAVPADERATPPAQTPVRIPSRALLGERKEIVIVHNGREYRLRQTQNGKLILTA